MIRNVLAPLADPGFGIRGGVRRRGIWESLYYSLNICSLLKAVK
jgi:hypothetical protein